MTTPILQIEKLNVYYGILHVLKGIDLQVYPGEIVALVGSNGAGKSTLLRTISGLIRPKSGRIVMDGENITFYPPYLIASHQVAHVPEGRRIFANLTVRENLVMGAYLQKKIQAFENDLEKVFVLFPRLKERLYQNAGSLSGGEQQMLALARALVAQPKLLLLDEPSLGLGPIVVDDIFRVIQEINQKGVTVLLVEQNVVMAIEVARRAYVMETGRLVFQGNAKEIQQNEYVKKVYLGG